MGVVPNKEERVSDQSVDKGGAGTSDHEQHRAGPDEGVRAPFSTESGEPPQISIFDGKGDESVVVAADNDAGIPSQGTGASAEEALADAKDPSDTLGEDFGNA